MIKGILIMIWFLVVPLNVFAGEKESKWETTIKMRASVLHLPWEGPFVRAQNRISPDWPTGVRTFTERVTDTTNQNAFGGGFQISHFYKENLFGKNVPIELGIGGYYTKYENVTTWMKFGAEPQYPNTRSGWTFIDGVTTKNSSAIFLDNEVLESEVKRKIYEFGVDFLARLRIPLKEGSLQFTAGPSFFRMTQKTEMYSFEYEPLKDDPDNKDFSNTDEKLSADYYGFKIQTDFSLPLNKIIPSLFSNSGFFDDFNIKSRFSVGGYALNAKYEGQQYTDFSFTDPSITNRTAEDDHTIFSYTGEAELGLEYDTGFGLISVSGEARYLSKTPNVNYVALGTIQPSHHLGKADHTPAHLNFSDAYSYGGNIEFKYLF